MNALTIPRNLNKAYRETSYDTRLGTGYVSKLDRRDFLRGNIKLI